MTTTLPTAEQLKQTWATDPRWAGIQRGYSAEEVVRLRGTVAVEHFHDGAPQRVGPFLPLIAKRDDSSGDKVVGQTPAPVDEKHRVVSVHEVVGDRLRLFIL